MDFASCKRPFRAPCRLSLTAPGASVAQIAATSPQNQSGPPAYSGRTRCIYQLAAKARSTLLRHNFWDQVSLRGLDLRRETAPSPASAPSINGRPAGSGTAETSSVMVNTSMAPNETVLPAYRKPIMLASP